MKNGAQTIDQLIRFGANVNSIQHDTSLDQFGARKDRRFTPIRIVCVYGNLQCARVLIENGADLQIDSLNDKSLVSLALTVEKLDIVKYLLIEKKLPIPEYCVIRQPGGKDGRKMTMTEILQEVDFSHDPDKKNLKQEILSFLEANGKK